MYSSGILGLTAAVFAVQFAPDMQALGGLPMAAIVLLVSAFAYLGYLWHSAGDPVQPDDTQSLSTQSVN